MLRLLGFGSAAMVLDGCGVFGGGGGGGALDGEGGAGVAPTVRLGPPPASVVAAGSRVLVLIELSGGNDGLSTLVPIDDGRYQSLRPRLALSPEDVVGRESLGGGFAAHKGLQPIVAQTAFIQGVGVARPDLSHFAMLSRWWQGDPDGKGAPIAGSVAGTGFLGRCCDVVRGSEPITGVSLGFGASPALAAAEATTLSLPNLDMISSLGESSDATNALRNGWRRFADATDGEGDPALLASARRGLGGALSFIDTLASLPDAPTGYPETDLGAQLALASRLIRAGTGIRVLHVPYGSFDTHAGQRGNHDAQISELGAAVAAFLDDVQRAGRGGEVLVATTSEFGRRPETNGEGTDHGTASVALLAGPVQPGRHGEAPSLNELDEDGNLVATTAMEDYYATLAQGWLGIPAGSVLGGGPSVMEGVLHV